MTSRVSARLLILMMAAIPVARAVSSPRWNPLPICIAMPLLAIGLLHDRSGPSHGLAVVGSVMFGAFIGFALIISGMTLGYGGVFPTPGFQFRGTYYGWDTLYGPASAYVGALATLAMLRWFGRRRGGAAARTLRERTP
jgi:hypothetical protein